jgi:hypothetical protein
MDGLTMAPSTFTRWTTTPVRCPNVALQTYLIQLSAGSFAIQFLQLLYSKLAGKDDPTHAEEYRNRARLFALDFIHYFDETGRALPFGRSLVYRFAMVAFWGAIAYADIELPPPLTWGIVKGIYLRNLRWWQNQPSIFDSSGCLTIGYTYPNMYMAENYNSPGSPYWAMLAFITLAVPADHPFWTSEEEPYPSEKLPAIKPLRQPGHIMVRSGGHTFLLSSGQMCGYAMKAMHAKYGKFAYSSAFAYSVPPGSYSLDQYALDSTLGLSEDGGEMWKTRGYSDSRLEELEKGYFTLVSTWRPYSDVKVTTWLVPPDVDSTPNWHLRVHKIETGRLLMTADGSFAICSVAQDSGRNLGGYDSKTCEGSVPLILGDYDSSVPEARATSQAGAFVSNLEAGAVGIAGLEHGEHRTAVQLLANANSNLVEPRTVIPTLRGDVAAGQTVWYITAVYAKPAGEGVQPWTYLDGWEKRPAVPQWLQKVMQPRASL